MIQTNLIFLLSFFPSSICLTHYNSYETDEVGNTAAFLASPLASAITGAVIFVDNGLNAMGMAVDSPIIKTLDIPTDKH